MVSPVTSPILYPHLTVRDAAAAIAFYQKAFGAEETARLPLPGGTAILHAELRIGAAVLFLNDEFPEMGGHSPQALNGSPVTLHLQVEDVDAWFERAIEAGATVTMPLQDMFWGDRYGQLVDPFGHRWSLASKIEEVSPEVMQQRLAASFSQR